MPIIDVSCAISNTVEDVFDVARSIEAHRASQAQYKERPVAGRLSGLIELGESVTWEATHLGVRQRLTSKVTAMDRPHSFCDEQVEGAFVSFTHTHLFEPTEDGGTCMRDIFEYRVPFGWLGRFADRLFLRRYMERLLVQRGVALKALAEGATEELTS